MKAKYIREALHQSPFKPFQVVLTNGRAVRVPHPEHALLTSDGSLFVVENDEGSLEMLDVPLIISIDQPTAKNWVKSKSS
jgi:hypothetical protein